MAKAIGLWEAAQKGDVDKVMSLVTGELSERDQLALHYAAQKGHVEVVRILLQHGFDINKKAKNNNTPLHLAAQNGHSEVARVLLEQGADGQAASTSGTPAAVAKDSKTKEVIESFVNRSIDNYSYSKSTNNSTNDRRNTNDSQPKPAEKAPEPKLPSDVQRIVSLALEENWDGVAKLAQTILEVPTGVYSALPLAYVLRVEEEFHSVHLQSSLNAREKADSAQSKLSDLQANLKDSQERLSMEQSEVERLEQELQRARSSLVNLQREISKNKSEVEQLQRRINIDSKEADRYNDVLAKEEKKVSELKTQVEDFKSKLNSGDLGLLSVQDVSLLLNELKMARYKDKFNKEKVSGKVLDRLSEGDLKTDLGIESLAERKRLISVIQKIKNRAIEFPLIGGSSNGAGPAKWSVNEVAEWLQTLDLGEYTRRFKDESITGDVLLALTSDDLRSFLRMERLGDRILILEEIKKLQDQVSHNNHDEI
eukprot:TRINITY_DN17_c0_g1_i1.p1 TRINITY_DN17_c0_g1~~TRINITY_DN17_c0_g1_i1.p1  ORF type:complete len:482 (-),score=138.05 TRINITY_DN17_c0_g1_i1:183-1628(-)